MMRIIALIGIFFLLGCSNNNDKNKIRSEIAILSDSIKKAPRDTRLLFERYIYNNKRNNLESAVFDLKQCVQLDSLNDIFHFELARVSFELSKNPNANVKYPAFVKKHIKKAIELNDKDYRYHSLLGELLLAYAKYKKAIDSFNRSLTIEYNQPNTHMLMGYAFKQLEQDDNAINCFRNALNIDPEFKEAFIQLGNIFTLKADTLAIIYYNNALNIDPKDEVVLYNKAYFYQSILAWNEALEAYADLHKINAFHSNGHYNIGFIHMELGLYDIAANNFSDALYGNSEFFEAYYSRGNCFETLGNISQAESDYRKAIEINPEYVFAIEALELLEEKNKKFNKK